MLRLQQRQRPMMVARPMAVSCHKNKDCKVSAALIKILIPNNSPQLWSTRPLHAACLTRRGARFPLLRVPEARRAPKAQAGEALVGVIVEVVAVVGVLQREVATEWSDPQPSGSNNLQP
jgi:hypothetical protein